MHVNERPMAHSPEAVGGLREDGASGFQRHFCLAVAVVDAQGAVRSGEGVGAGGSVLRAIEFGGWVAWRGWWCHNQSVQHGLDQSPNRRLRNEPPRNKLKRCACESVECLTGSWH